jgi:hypothetical protein
MRSAEFAIYLFAEDVPQSIHSLFDCRSGMKCRCCAILAILSMTILIAEDEARSAELVQAILLSYPFFVYSPEAFCLPALFPAYHMVTRMRQTYLSLSYI